MYIFINDLIENPYLYMYVRVKNYFLPILVNLVVCLDSNTFENNDGTAYMKIYGSVGVLHRHGTQYPHPALLDNQGRV